jgi:hypothetical protein
VCLSNVLCEIPEAVVEGNAVWTWVNVVKSSAGVVVHNMEEEVGPVGELLRTVGAGVIYWASSGVAPWHRLVGAEPVGDLLAELVSLNEVVVILFVWVKLMGALRGKRTSMSLTFWMQQGVEGEVRLWIGDLAVGAEDFWRGLAHVGGEWGEVTSLSKRAFMCSSGLCW